MGRCIVIYFSRSGKTEAVANEISRCLNCETLRIKPAKRYSRFYPKVLLRAYIERRNNIFPKISKTSMPNLSMYDTIIIGYPIWAEEAPRIIYSFLAANKFKNKKIIPFCTYSYKPGNHDDKLAAKFKNNIWLGSLEVKAKNASRCKNQVEEFVRKNVKKAEK